VFLVASALTYCLIFVFLVEWMVKGEWVAENFISSEKRDFVLFIGTCK